MRKWISILVFVIAILLLILFVRCFISSTPVEIVEIHGGRGGQTIGADGEDSDSYKIVDGKIVVDKKGCFKGGRGGGSKNGGQGVLTVYEPFTRPSVIGGQSYN